MHYKTPIKDLVDHLKHNRKADVPVNGFMVAIEYAPVGALLNMKTTVYQAVNYIPPSVRQCLSPQFKGPISPLRTFLHLDEEKYAVSLNFDESIQHITQDTLTYLLEEFSWVAEEWRRLLEDHDQRDLLHVRAK